MLLTSSSSFGSQPVAVTPHPGQIGSQWRAALNFIIPSPTRSKTSSDHRYPLNGIHNSHIGSDGFLLTQESSPEIPAEFGSRSQFSEHLIELYYSKFHAAHPILLPFRKVRDASFAGYPSYLENVIFFIGSHFSSHYRTEEYRLRAERILSSRGLETPFAVQALLLLAIALHARDEQDQAGKCLKMAIDIALHLEMHLKPFSDAQVDDSRLLAESWRRTWWELCEWIAW